MKPFKSIQRHYQFPFPINYALRMFGVLVLTVLTSLLSACGDSIIEKLEQDIAADEEARRGVYVALSTDLQTAMAIAASQIEISLRRVAADGNEYTSTLMVTDATASDKPPKTKAVDQYQYHIKIWYRIAGSNEVNSPLLLGETFKVSNKLRVEFAVDELYTVPYDTNGDMIIDSNEKSRLDFDLDGQSNLTEIVEGGHPQNSSPTFTSPANISLVESAETRGYSFYIATAISPRTDTVNGNRRAITYGLNTAGTDNRLQNVLSIDPVTGALSTVVGQRLPAYDNGLLAKNVFPIALTASDIIDQNKVGSIGDINLVLTITDIFNLTLNTPMPGTGAGMHFAWQGIDDTSGVPAQYYQLLQDLDGDGGYVTLSQQDGNGNPIPLKIAATEYFYDVPLHLAKTRPETRYKLDAYQASGALIATSSALRLGDTVRFPEDIIAMIGYLTPMNGGDFDNFGESVSLSADGLTLAVGATFEDGGPEGDKCVDLSFTPTVTCQEDSGGVWVFTYTPSGWQQQAYLKASNAGKSDFFGRSVSLSADGQTLAVGAVAEDGGRVSINCSTPNMPELCTKDSGALYVFVNTTSGWQEQAYLKAGNTAGGGDLFGTSVSLSANGLTLVAGATEEDGGPQGDFCDALFTPSGTCQVNSGAVYVFAYKGNRWQQLAYLKASNAGVEDSFGRSVSLSADGLTLAVGAASEDGGSQGDTCDTTNPCQTDSGVVYMFTNSTANGWQEQAYLKASNVGTEDYFGSVVSLSADGLTLAVVAPSEDGGVQGDNCNLIFTPTVKCQENSGAVYVFANTAGNWLQQAYLKVSNAGAVYGSVSSVSLSVDGRTLAVGARAESGAHLGLQYLAEQDPNITTLGDVNNVAYGSGAAYLYQKLNDVWQLQVYIKASNTEEGDLFAFSVALSADAQTLAIGAIGEDGGGPGDDCVRSGGSQPPWPSPFNNCQPDSGAVYVY